MNQLIISFVFMASGLVYAQHKFAPLLQDFLTSNLQLKINRIQQSQSTIERAILRGQKTWSLMGDTNYQTYGKKQTSLMGVTKFFEWGGRLRAEHSRFTSERSIMPNNKKTSITYSQDLGRNFFGKQFYLSLELAEENIKYSDLTLSEENQKELKHFYQQYLQTRLTKTLFSLQKQALKRAVDRLNEIKRKVKDGLSEKSDLYLAEIEYLRKKENLTSTKSSWENTKRELSQKLGRDIRDHEIQQVSLKNKNSTDSKQYALEENLNLKKIETNLRRVKKEIENLKRNYIPKINMGITTKESSPSPTELEHIISLNIQLPLSFNQEKLQVSHKKVAAMSLEMTRKLALQNLEVAEKNLEREIITLLENLKTSLSRIEIAKKNLKENTKLYSIGKTNLDILLRAEEELIRTELSYVNSWFRYEVAVTEKATLYGKLLETIKGH